MHCACIDPDGIVVPGKFMLRENEKRRRFMLTLDTVLLLCHETTARLLQLCCMACSIGLLQRMA